jgi:hypothetical protein
VSRANPCGKCAINQICHKGHPECLAIRAALARVRKLEGLIVEFHDDRVESARISGNVWPVDCIADEAAHIAKRKAGR